MANNSSPLPNFVFKLRKPWEKNENPIWLASTITLQRNIEKFKFPGKLDTERKKQIIALVSKEVFALDQLRNPVLLKAEELSSLEKEYLAEHFFTMSSFHQMSSGEAFITDEMGELLTIFNMSDHLSFIKIDAKEDLEGSWAELVKLETGLGKNLTYSFSSKYGFLTSDPAKCGTALTAAVYLQVPALMHSETIDNVLEKNGDESLLISGIQGDPEEIVGDVIAVRNNYTLGLTEENIISSIHSFASKLVSEEKNARLRILQSQDPLIIDKVTRAFAILLHSYQIEAVEALNAISILKLGLEMEWISGISREELNSLFLSCRRAHLLSRHSEKIRQEETSHERAKFIHTALKKAALLV